MTENNKPESQSIDEQYNNVEALLRKNKRISPFWLLPFIALCIWCDFIFPKLLQETRKDDLRSRFLMVQGWLQIKHLLAIKVCKLVL